MWRRKYDFIFPNRLARIIKDRRDKMCLTVFFFQLEIPGKFDKSSFGEKGRKEYVITRRKNNSPLPKGAPTYFIQADKGKWAKQTVDFIRKIQFQGWFTKDLSPEGTLHSRVPKEVQLFLLMYYLSQETYIGFSIQPG